MNNKKHQATKEHLKTIPRSNRRQGAQRQEQQWVLDSVTKLDNPDLIPNDEVLTIVPGKFCIRRKLNPEELAQDQGSGALFALKEVERLDRILSKVRSSPKKHKQPQAEKNTSNKSHATLPNYLGAIQNGDKVQIPKEEFSSFIGEVKIHQRSNHLILTFSKFIELVERAEKTSRERAAIESSLRILIWNESDLKIQVDALSKSKANSSHETSSSVPTAAMSVAPSPIPRDTLEKSHERKARMTKKTEISDEIFHQKTNKQNADAAARIEEKKKRDAEHAKKSAQQKIISQQQELIKGQKDNPSIKDIIADLRTVETMNPTNYCKWIEEKAIPHINGIMKFRNRLLKSSDRDMKEKHAPQGYSAEDGLNGIKILLLVIGLNYKKQKGPIVGRIPLPIKMPKFLSACMDYALRDSDHQDDEAIALANQAFEIISAQPSLSITERNSSDVKLEFVLPSAPSKSASLHSSKAAIFTSKTPAGTTTVAIAASAAEGNKRNNNGPK